MELTPSHGQAKTDSPYRLGEPGERVFKYFNEGLQRAIIESYEQGKGRLFTVSTDGLFDIYLNSFNSNFVEKQLHNCNCCRHFIKHYGGLVYINEEGVTHAAVWNEAHLDGSLPAWYWEAVRNLAREVEKRAVVNQFLWDQEDWGTRMAGGFSHFHTPPAPCSFEATLTASQAMAVRREDRKHLAVALHEWKPQHLQQAIAMLQLGGLANAQALLPMATFLHDVQGRINSIKGKKSEKDDRRNNILWHAVGHAARGWCTPRGSALGALMDDIIAGRSTAATTRAHDERMHPLKYQRPQAAPSAGNVARAEKIFEQLGLAASLRRRPMALEEARCFWHPRRTIPRKPNDGIFSHLETKDGPPPSPPTTVLSSTVVTMTWVKFERDILSRTLKIHLKTPHSGNYCAFTTATDPTAPPIMQWDRDNKRNPGDWYIYHPSSTSQVWGLPGGTFVEVLGLSHPPSSWHGSTFEQKPYKVLAVLQGAKDNYVRSLAIFPQSVKNELHEVRATIEAASKAGRLDPEDRQRASGYLIGSGGSVDLCVTTDIGLAYYRIDRLE